MISILPIFSDNTNTIISDPDSFYWLLRLFTLLVGLNFIFQFFIFKRHDKAFYELDRSLSDVKHEIEISTGGNTDKMDIMTISAVLNHSLRSLKEKNERLKAEIEKNERLSENISEFYRQMRTLRDADLIFDFFDYDIKSSEFTFISGMITALSGETEATEISAENLFNTFGFDITFMDFIKHVEDCLEKDCDMNFKCSIKGGEEEAHWLKFWGRPTKDKTRITGAITDITREVRSRNIEKERTIRDNITGFYNRNALAEIGGKVIAECGKDEHVVFVYIGLTGYQEFQERFGMVAGNSYIRVCAEVLKKFVVDNMIPVRWWGSDFLIIIKGVKDLDVFKKETISVVSKIEKYIGDVDGIAVTFPMAIGYSASGIHGKTPAELLEYAAFAEHEVLRQLAKSPNEFNYERFEEAHMASLRRTFIKDIIDRNQLGVVFQPIVSLRTGELFGFEALSRPLNPIYGNILELIDDAEASGHYVILEKRMVYNALDTYMARDPKFKDHYLFINTAPYATLDEKDYNDIRDRYFSHMKVVFEVIERNRMDPDEINLRKSIVRKAGAKFALDDFGSGYSNHLALLALEPDIIKIDREMVREINEDLRKQHMLEDIISYARYRGTRVLAEGVETQEELATLCRIGVDYVQGYFTGRPNATLAEPDAKAKKIIKSIIRNKDIDLRQLYILIEKSLALINENYARILSITVYLMIKLGKRLNLEGDKFENLIITSIFHEIGALYPGYKGHGIEKNDEMTEHSIFSYLLYKEFSPYPEYARIILYHYKKYGVNGVPGNISIPEEAYLLSISCAIADVIVGSKEEDIYANIDRRIKEDGFKPEYKAVLEQLCEENMLSRITSGEYRRELLSFIEAVKLNKTEIISLLETYIYAVTFRSPYNYAHANIMETIVGLLCQMTKQNWNMMERASAASMLYCLGLLTFDKETFEKEHSPVELHQLFNKAIEKINVIFEAAELIDIVDVFNAITGETTFSGNHILMGKDIISGANMINIADILASCIEKKYSMNEISCRNAFDELRDLSKTENLYLPLIELMEDYADDIEARIKSNQTDVGKHYHNVITGYEKLRDFLIDSNNKTGI
ncbi:MAG: EAL domain-containing protein [Acetivibrionales bacterium]